MTKRIKHVSELPSWFDLKKYEFTKTLNSLGWFKQLIPRVLLFCKSDITSHEIKQNHESILQEFTLLARNNPCLLIDDHTASELFALIHENTLENNKQEQFLGVYPVKPKKHPQNPCMIFTKLITISVMNFLSKTLKTV